MVDLAEKSLQFVEIFHSKPSWKKAYVQFRTTPGEWANPRDAPLVYAEHIRERFRVYRMKYTGGPLHFVITNGTARDWDSPPDGQESYCIDQPGRYVVEHNIRRVGDADVDECTRALVYDKDCHVQVSFIADLWEACYCAYSADGKDWIPAPGKKMTIIEATPRTFSVTVNAKELMLAFNNGEEEPIWDSNHGQNFKIGLPGKYRVEGGVVHYMGRADADLSCSKPSPVVSNSITAANPSAFSPIKS